jgi:hypothetical protein
MPPSAVVPGTKKYYFSVVVLQYCEHKAVTGIVSVHRDCDTLTLTAPRPGTPVPYSRSSVLELSTRTRSKPKIPSSCMSRGPQADSDERSESGLPLALAAR